MIRKLSIIVIASILLISSAYAASPSEDKLFRMTFEKIDDHNIELNNLEIVDETPPNDIDSSGEYLLELQSSDNQTLYTHNFSFGYEIKGHFGDSGRIRGGELSEVKVIIPYFRDADHLQVSDHHGDVLLRETIEHPTETQESRTDRTGTETGETTEDESLLSNPVIWVISGVPVAVLLVLFYRRRV